MTGQFQELDGDCTFVLCGASPHFFHGTSNMTSNNKTKFCEMEASGVIMVFFPQKAKDSHFDCNSPASDIGGKHNRPLIIPHSPHSF